VLPRHTAARRYDAVVLPDPELAEPLPIWVQWCVPVDPLAGRGDADALSDVDVV